MFLGAFASNIGTWMQNVVLGAYAYDLTHSSTFVGVVIFAQLGPTLVLPMVGGLLADKVDRKRFLILLSLEQLVFSLGVALVAASSHPSHVLLVVMVLFVGAGSAMFGPAYSAILPGLVGREDLAGAISLNSAQMNASRVIGPVIGGVLYSLVGPAWVFAGNAVTYLFVVGALLMVTLPAVPQFGAGVAKASRWRELTAGITVARHDRVVGRCLVTVFVFSLLALAFIGQMPVVAAHNLGIDLSDLTRLWHPLRLLRDGSPRRRHLHRDRLRSRRPSPCSSGCALSVTPCLLRLRPRALAHSRLCERRGRRRLLLRLHHGTQHDAAGPARRACTRTGDGAVDDGVRRHGRNRQPPDRPGRRRGGHHGRPALRSGRGAVLGLVRRRTILRTWSVWSWPSRPHGGPSCRAFRSRPGEAGR